MKPYKTLPKVVALLILLFTAQFSFAQDVDIPDGAFLFVLIYEGYDVNDDHVIQVSEAEAVTSLFLANKIINSLEGISAFVNLETLHANRNRLSGTLDLSALVNLRDLNISENMIEEVNIEGLDNLVEFNADRNNLASLNLNGLDKLRNVSAQYNSLSEFSISDLPNIHTLDISNNSNLMNINLASLPILDDFRCSRCGVSELGLTNLPNLDDIDLFGCNNLEEYTFTGFPELTRIDVGSCSSLTFLSLDGLPKLRTLIARFAALESLIIKDCQGINTLDLQTNALAQLELKNLPFLVTLDLEDNVLEAIDLSELTNLRTLTLDNNLLTNLNASGLIHLIELSLENNLLEEIVLEDLPSLTDLDLNSNNLANIDLTGLPALVLLRLNNNQLTELNLANFDALFSISTNSNPLHTVSLSNMQRLEWITLTANQLTTAAFVDLPNVERLDLTSNQLSILDISGLVNLEYLTLDENLLTSLDLSNLLALKEISINDNLLSSLTVQGIPNLWELNLQRNKLSDLLLSDLPRVREINISSNKLVEFNLHGMPFLEDLNCEQNLLTNLQLYDLQNLENLICRKNSLERLDVFNLPDLVSLDCTDNVLKEMDFSSGAIRFVDMSNNALEFINFRNEEAEGNQMQFANNPDLAFICIDDEDFGDIVGKIIIYEMDTEVIRNCELTDPNFYEISGKSTFDFEMDDCSEDDPVFRNLKFVVQSGDEETCYIASASGFHSILLEGQEHTVIPIVDDELYSITPEVANVNFGNLTTRATKIDFCITPKVSFTDLNIDLVGLSEVRPGFEAEYKLIYRNRGAVPSSGEVVFHYDENLSELIETSLAVDSNTGGQIVWSFDNLAPQKSGVILFSLEMNKPQDTPPLLGDEVLKFSASIASDVKDFELNNNETTLCQTVVNSFDPNDKQCSQGEVIKPEQLDDFLNYTIRFENTGTASAINIVVVDAIDQERLDVSTLEIIDASHEMVTRIVDGNIVNFVFDDIRLPFDDENNDGYIAFKIKPLATLQPEQVIANSASIFFDFNDPILTNTIETIILRDDDNDGYFEDVDCDDSNSDINPANEEIAYNGIDDDCNPMTLDDDLDGDGYAVANDCDDENTNINPDQVEEPYNGIDDDCNPLTLDDDLDGDGYAVANDCDDENTNINPDQVEEPYNGIDDDCNPLTLDDDLDGDGYGLADDCDDENANVNPDAVEIPNNGIDEDCDGNDLLTSVKELSTSLFKIYPNPAIDQINIETSAGLNFIAMLFDSTGRRIKSVENLNVLNVSLLPKGIYLLEIREMETARTTFQKIVIAE